MTESEFLSEAVEHLGGTIVDLLRSHVPNDSEGLKARDEAQGILVALGNLAAGAGRADLRAVLYELSDATGGRAKV